ncbi:MAG: flagellar biosynthesis protein FliQ [Fimbriimonas sp.]
MDQANALALARQGVEIGLVVLLPILAVCLFIGLIVSVFQALTQIQEQTLSFLPKLVGVGIACALMGNWMLTTLVAFMRMCLERVGTVGGGL